MSDKVEDEIFGLMIAVQDQQAAVQTALARLAAQEAALKEERRVLAETLAAVQNQLVLARRAAEEIGPELQRRTDQAVRTAIANSLAGAGDAAAQAIASSSGPMVERLAAAVASAEAVGPALQRVMAWLTWRLIGRLGAIAVGLLMLMVAARIGLEAWTDYRLASAQAESSLLEAKVAGLQDTRDVLERAGGKAGITKCGPSLRLCIRVDEATGPFGDQADYRVIRGY